ncbi:MAG TPA: lipase maturation factor family protein [Planctomycetota bacterium]|nr:lipase maturation factor family protein [Planctomycetota bacterium]
MLRRILEEPSGHVRVRGLFLTGLGVVYLCAFVSLWVQIHGLIGEHGIAPAGDTLDWVEQRGGGLLRFPTLLWLGWGDRALDLLCGGGGALSVSLILGFARLPCLVLLWAFYLSLFRAGLMFTSFQWDTLLLESGFLAIFLAPWNPTPWGARGRSAPFLAIWAQRYLIFRLMFASGVVKITAGDRAWWPDLTALSYHYRTQPLPTVLAWYADHFPMWFHKATAVATFAVELVVPFLIVLGRIPRLLAFLCFVGLQITIALTGNYGFFNLLTAVIALTLLDDSMLPWKRELTAAPPGPVARWARRCALVPLLLLATLEFAAGLGWKEPPDLHDVRVAADPLRLTSSYGLFRVMTKERREIVVEGSRDGKTWEPYAFQWKPGDPLRAPGLVQPHMPRLDWQMWFAALRDEDEPAPWWFDAFLARLLENEPSVTALLERNPFPGEPPHYIRATSYRYEFTTAEERRATGAWWKRTDERPYSPVRWLRPG